MTSTDNRAPLDFLAIMSHEIRTPLQSIFGVLELLEAHDMPGPARPLLDIARKSSVDLLRLLDDILDFTKCDINRMELDRFEVPVRLLVHGVIEALSITAGSRPVKLSARIDDNVPLIIAGDPKRLRQILINLAGNSVKFTQAGSVTIHVRIDAGRLCFDVSDTGPGIDEDVQKRLFEPFTQADASTARLYGGSGLGLSIARKLVELMRGDIGVTSQPGQGSTFWFAIPFEAVTAEGDTHTLPDLTGLRVLIVEDHPSAQAEIQGTMRRMNAESDIAGSVADAQQRLSRARYDVAIVDEGLPDGRGIDLIRRMSAGFPETACILYTVRNAPDLHFTLNSLGGRYLAKPASRAGLGRAVSELTRRGAAAGTARAGQARVLVVDDTESVRIVLSHQLALLGAAHDFAASGQEALSMLQAGTYTLVLTDFHMPDMDGGQLAATLQGRVPVIVLSADVDLMNPDRVHELGFADRLIKPVSLGHLQRTLMRWGVLQNAPETARPLSTAQKWAAILAAHNLSGHLDTDLLAENLGRIDADTPVLMASFIALNDEAITALPALLDDSNRMTVAECAHALAGAALSMGFTALGESARTLETKCRNNTAGPADIDAVIRAFRTAEKITDTLKTATL